MHNTVSEPTYAMPVDARTTVFKLLRQTIGSFTNDLKVADHSIHRFAVTLKVFETLSGSIVKDLMSTLQNVSNQKFGSRLDIDDLPLYCLKVFVFDATAGYQIHLFL